MESNDEKQNVIAFRVNEKRAAMLDACRREGESRHLAARRLMRQMLDILDATRAGR
jgi:hypothetical protein